MRVVLEIQPGSVAPRSITIEAGSEVRIGRTAPAEVVLSDSTVSRQHCAIYYNGRTCRIRDLGSTHGTLVNQQAVTQAVLYDGDMIQVGMTTLRIRFAEEEINGPTTAEWPKAAETAPLIAVDTTESPVIAPTLHDMVIQTLRTQQEPLYAILDAARDPLILAHLLNCKEEHQSLYEGAEGDKLAAYAPYLVALPRRSAFLETIVRDGWGKSWGVYLTCDKPFKEVRKHMRHFLIVQLERGKQVYFRFYDPRVLRTFLPTCTPHELTQFFGPIRGFLLEHADPTTVQRLWTDSKQLLQQAIHLIGETPGPTMSSRRLAARV
jgi:pSer/pThr/pTyr-binding forkhead associated (FHA) protein